MADNVTVTTHLFAIVPFVLLLGMIATGPLLYPHFWHRFYHYIAMGLAATVILYYIAILHESEAPIEALVDYIQFILLIGALYIVSGNVMIRLGCAASPRNNVLILWLGSLIANLIGTTGASMLLIRPYMKLNKKRLQPYHIVFFIFMVSNVGGALTCMADPPLFLGYLKGVPFLWTLTNDFMPWLLALILLGGLFYWLDAGNTKQEVSATSLHKPLEVQGIGYGMLYFVIVFSLFIDPNKFDWVPYIPFGSHHKISFVRELLLLGIIIGVYLRGNKKVLTANQFSFEPLKEVIFVFIGIFGTMPPAIALIKDLAFHYKDSIGVNGLYWITGILSSVLDNAPTYVNLLTAGMSANGLDISRIADVVAYSEKYAGLLRATSIAAVFFGAMTYIGNGPNFMVRAMAEEQGVKMPSFFGYMRTFALRYLLPILFIVWGVFVVTGFGA